MWKWSKDMQKEQNVRLVLASASPRRRELLSQIGLEFTVMPSTKEENAKTTEAGAGEVQSESGGYLGASFMRAGAEN